MKLAQWDKNELQFNKQVHLATLYRDLMVSLFTPFNQKYPFLT